MKRCSIQDLTSKQYGRFRSLNFRERGMLQDTLGVLRTKRQYSGLVADNCFNQLLYLELDGKLAAYCLCFYKNNEDVGKVLSVYFYTRREFRGRGIGKQLFKAADEYCAELKHEMAVYPHDCRSYALFDACSKTAKSKVNYWDA